MKNFIINSNDYLSQDIKAFYHEDYIGRQYRHLENGTIEHLICSFKNDVKPIPISVLEAAKVRLSEMLNEDLPQIIRLLKISNPTICVVPRAKVQYHPDQLYFRETIKKVVREMSGVQDGVDYIIRTTNTRTTHKNYSGYGGDGEMPRPKITIDTCAISDEVKGKDIILIDDLYTRSVNIDEDAIEALLQKGAKSVVFYAVGRTVERYNY